MPWIEGHSKMLLYFVSLLCLTGPVFGQSWNYLDHGEDWGGLCKNGSQQSPININTSNVERIYGEPLQFWDYYREVLVRVEIDAAHYTVKVTPLEEEKPGIYGGGLPGDYIVDSMHFHWPAEHTINGNRDLLECHIVHRLIKYKNITQAAQSPHGIAVLGTLYEKSWTNFNNPQLTKIVNAAANEGEITLNFFDMLPKDKYRFFKYNGSLTTPNCAESVIWIVFAGKQYTTMSQVNQIYSLLEDDSAVETYRDIQPLNGRRVGFWSWRDSTFY